MASETPKTDGGPSAPPGEKDKEEGPSNFIREIISSDRADKKNDGRVATRFPPEPNGYLHIGHAKSIVLNFGMAQEFQGTCNLRFDDTNPVKEDVEYVDSIREDIRWLGFDWQDREYYASDYFDKLYEYAEHLIRAGKAYVCDLSADEIRDYRGTFTSPGRESPYRNRSVEENLDLFRRMRAGEFEEGFRVLRARIDMTSPNMNMRDPAIYRIKKASHHRTGDRWCIYPMYDWAHGLSDSIEGITHSLCTLEFEDHRPLYDWFLDQLPVEHHPRQIEFARLNLTYTVMSKRKLLDLVEGSHVSGWDDPRMPTISGMRRRGFTPEAIRSFCERIGVAKRDGVVDVSLLEHAVRDHLNTVAPRVMCVLNPLKVVIENYPEGQVDELDAPYFPDEPSRGSRKVPLSRVVYIEKEDFREDPPKKWWRLSPGKEIRLRYACYITCVGFKKDPRTGEVEEVICTWDPESRGGASPDGRRVRGTSHWVSAAHAVPAEVRLYDRLFNEVNPLDQPEGRSWIDALNPESLTEIKGCMAEASLVNAPPGSRYQFERLGYFCTDARDSRPGLPVFNRTISLKDSWAKIERSMKSG